MGSELLLEVACILLDLPKLPLPPAPLADSTLAEANVALPPETDVVEEVLVLQTGVDVAAGAEGVADVGVGDIDLALDGIKGTDAGFKFDLILEPNAKTSKYMNRLPNIEGLKY